MSWKNWYLSHNFTLHTWSYSRFQQPCRKKEGWGGGGVTVLLNRQWIVVFISRNLEFLFIICLFFFLFCFYRNHLYFRPTRKKLIKKYQVRSGLGVYSLECSSRSYREWVDVSSLFFCFCFCMKKWQTHKNTHSHSVYIGAFNSRCIFEIIIVSSFTLQQIRQWEVTHFFLLL